MIEQVHEEEQGQGQEQVQEQSVARLARQWDGYLKKEASCLAPMGVKILFAFCCLRVPQATKRKKIVADSGTKSLYGMRNACF